MKRLIIIIILFYFVCMSAASNIVKTEKALYLLAEKITSSYKAEFAYAKNTAFKTNIIIGKIENISKKAEALQIGQAVRELLSGVFSRSMDFAVIERDKLDMILKEQELQMSDVTDDFSAVHIGSILNAKAILYGYVTELAGSFTVSCTLVDIEAGKTLTEQVSIDENVLIAAAEKRLDMMYAQPMGIGISVSGLGITYTGAAPTFMPFPEVNSTIFVRNISAEVRYRITGFIMGSIGLEYVYGQLDHFDSLSWDVLIEDFPEQTGTAPFNVVGTGIGMPINLTLLYSPLRWLGIFLSAGGEYFILDCEGYFDPSNGMGFGVDDFGPTVHSEFFAFQTKLGTEIFVTPRLALSVAAGYQYAVFELDTSPVWHITNLPSSLEIDMSGLTLTAAVSVYF